MHQSQTDDQLLGKTIDQKRDMMIEQDRDPKIGIEETERTLQETVLKHPPKATATPSAKD